VVTVGNWIERDSENTDSLFVYEECQTVCADPFLISHEPSCRVQYGQEKSRGCQDRRRHQRTRGDKSVKMIGGLDRIATTRSALELRWLSRQIGPTAELLDASVVSDPVVPGKRGGTLRGNRQDERQMRPLIAGNWKMHGLADQLTEVEAIAQFVQVTSPEADVLICLPATLLSRAVQTAAGRIGIGGEDCHAEVAGAFTGDVSAEMLKDAGAKTVIVGHSERRRYHQETNAMVAAKAKAAWRTGLSTIICTGETQAQRCDGEALSVCGEQIAGSLPEEVARSGTTAIAYEPLWAIGTGHGPTSAEISEVHQHIRSCLTARIGPKGADIRILFGGSVTSDNAEEILSLPDVGGVLIGGASLKAADFDAVLRTIRARAEAPRELIV
jgi:triosephosphate isomerase